VVNSSSGNQQHMPRFELKTLTSYDDQSLIEELKRVATLIPGEKLARAEFDRLSKVDSGTLYRRFGGWRKALAAVGLENRFDDRHEAWSREEIIERLKSIAQRTGRKNITKRELSEGNGPADVLRLFGSHKAALVAAGLAKSRSGVRYSDEECYENILAVWTALGRQPHYAELKKTPSRVGQKAYIYRWGSWRKALQAFIERVNQDVPTEVQQAEIGDMSSDRDNSKALRSKLRGISGRQTKTDKSKPRQASRKSTQEIKIKRISRDIPLGLRYTVLVRDRFRCITCGRSPATNLNVNLHIDHIKAWANGGETVLENLRSLCSDCNLGKGCREEEKAMNSETTADRTDPSTSSG